MNGTEKLADEVTAQAREDEAAALDAARALEREGEQSAQAVFAAAIEDHLRRRRAEDPGMRFGGDDDTTGPAARRPVAPPVAAQRSPGGEFDDAFDEEDEDDENGGELRRGWLR